MLIELIYLGSMKEDYSVYFSKLYNYYIEFLSRSPHYQARLKEYSEILQELKGTQFKPLPAKIIPDKKIKPLKPHELRKPVIYPSGSMKGQGIWNISNKFTCDSNRIVLEIDIEKPSEILMKEIQAIIKETQKQYWKEMNDENWFGEYRYLIDFKRHQKGKNKKDTYPFDEWTQYIRVFDLKREGKSNKEIAKIIFPNENFSDNTKKKIRNYHSTARFLIEAAEKNKFPPLKLTRKP
jgi:hypothetical protein